tara:strand:+ start:216 stop:503 length:288 start_codon:yes stop_codon:yes gene_type:complete
MAASGFRVLLGMLVTHALYVLVGGVLLKCFYNKLIVERFCVDTQFHKPAIVPISFQTAVLVMVSLVLWGYLTSAISGINAATLKAANALVDDGAN